MEKKESTAADKIKRLKKQLYSKNFKDKALSASLKKKEYDVSEEWEDAGEKKQSSPNTGGKRTSGKKIILAVSISFFLVALGVAWYVIKSGANVFSLDKVMVNITAPASIGGGEPFTVDVRIKNDNETKIASADLVVEFPVGAYERFDSEEALTKTRIPLGAIDAGGIAEKSIPLVLFGSVNEEKEIRFSLEVRFEGSSATLSKEYPYSILLTSSPVGLSISLPKEVSIDQEFEIRIGVDSNTKNVLKNILLKVDYPSGFTLSGSEPKQMEGQRGVWLIGDLNELERREIVLRGKLSGQEGAKKAFVVSVGSRKKDDKNEIGTVYSTITGETVLTQPFLGLSIVVNGDESAGEYVAKSRQAIRFDILWKNNLQTKITNGEMDVKLIGDIINEMSVSADRKGFYRSLDDTIVWNPRTGLNEFSIIEPGSSGKMSFTLQSLPLVDKYGRVFKNPQIDVEVSAFGDRVTDVGSSERLSSSVSKRVKIETNLDVVPRAVYYVGPFKNTGPLPPVADTETTYTIIFSLTNTSNKVVNAEVRTSLPSYMRWMGNVSPKDEKVEFDEVGGEVVWKAGEVGVGTGYIYPPREVAFQVAFTPSVSQAKEIVPLTGDIFLTGRDTFTNTTVSVSKQPITTNLFTDPLFSQDQAGVEIK